MAWRGAARGFTLIELLVVLVIVAIAATTTTLALRSGDDVRLEREASRLAALLESGRAEARASGVPVRFELRDDEGASFAFAGLPREVLPQRQWLYEGVRARIEGPARAIALGPEPLIGAQRIVLMLGGQQRTLATDGLAPFAVATTDPGAGR